VSVIIIIYIYIITITRVNCHNNWLITGLSQLFPVRYYLFGHQLEARFRGIDATVLHNPRGYHDIISTGFPKATRPGEWYFDVSPQVSGKLFESGVSARLFQVLSP
jgi:hypothetical protein